MNLTEPTSSEFTVMVAKADEPGLPDRALLVCKRFPNDMTSEQLRNNHTEDAKAIADLLWKALPGGTIDALLVEMLDRKRSMFSILF
jgi:hypothetical protein